MSKLLVAVLLLGACGDNVIPEVPSPTPQPPPWAEAAHGPVPTLISLGGAVLTAPKIQPIFFAGDDVMQAKIEDFSAQLATSEYWSTTTAEYGVGSITALPAIVTTDTPPTTDAAMDAWLIARLDGTHTASGWPATIDEQTIYSVFTPQGVVMTGDFGISCDSYGGYHGELAGPAGEHVVIAFMPRCAAVDDLTWAFSHELIEAATDPYWRTTPAFGDADPDNYVMALTPGAETGDYCEYLDSAVIRAVGTFAVQRTWSNAASLAGKDPCVPAPATPYVAAVPMFTEQMTIDGFTGPVTTRGMALPNHMSKVVDVQLISDQPTDVFNVKAYDVAGMFGSPAELSFQWDKTTGKNGDVLHLTITRVRPGPESGSELYIESSVGPRAVSMWWGYVN